MKKVIRKYFHLKIIFCFFILLSFLKVDHLVAQNTRVLADGDILQIEVEDHPDLNTIISIGSDGSIYYPLLGEVAAEGLKIEQLEEEITLGLSEFIRRPKVKIRTKEQITGEGDISFSYNVYLFGEVPKPGAYVVTGKANAIQLISRAGGLSNGVGTGDLAQAGSSSEGAGGRRIAGSDLSRVTIIREGGEIDWVNINQLLKTGVGGEKIVLRPGDTVYVPPDSFSSIDILGEVVVPGTYALSSENQEISLLDAIALARGLTNDAGIHNIKVVRKVENGQYNTTFINLKKSILTNKTVPKMPMLKAGDSLYVSKSRLYHWNNLFRWIFTTTQFTSTATQWHDLYKKIQTKDRVVTTSETRNFYDLDTGSLIRSESKAVNDAD